jgi:hypothetical protein
MQQNRNTTDYQCDSFFGTHLARRIADNIRKNEKNKYNCNLGIVIRLCECEASGSTEGEQTIDDAARLHGICREQFNKNEDSGCRPQR